MALLLAILCGAALRASALGSIPGNGIANWPSGLPSPNFALVDSAGRLRTLLNYRGNVVAVVFGFTNCPDVCPAQLFKLALAVKKLRDFGKSVNVIFVTLDPVRDTSPVIRNYLKSFDVSFVGLTGSSRQINRTAERFNVQYARVALGTSYTMDHSSAVYIFDPQGRLRALGAESTSAEDFVEEFKDLTLFHTGN